MKKLSSFKKISAITICFVTVLLGGCATIMTGTSQVINVQAIDANTHDIIPNAKCTLTNSKGVYVVYGNPGSVTVGKEYGSLQSNCVAPGYHQSAVGTGESFNAWTIANVLFWPAFIVDAASGAAAKYPSHITILMERK